MINEGRVREEAEDLSEAIGHMLDWLHGEELDPESGLSHLDHAAASLGMLMDTVARVQAGHLQPDRDDRFKEDKS